MKVLASIYRALLFAAIAPTQTAYIIIDERTGERTVLWQRAGALRLSPDEILPADIINSRMLHIDGFDIDAAAHCRIHRAAEHNIPVSIDVDTVYPGFEAIIKKCRLSGCRFGVACQVDRRIGSLQGADRATSGIWNEGRGDDVGRLRFTGP